MPYKDPEKRRERGRRYYRQTRGVREVFRALSKAIEFVAPARVLTLPGVYMLVLSHPEHGLAIKIGMATSVLDRIGTHLTARGKSRLAGDYGYSIDSLLHVIYTCTPARAEALEKMMIAVCNKADELPGKEVFRYEGIPRALLDCKTPEEVYRLYGELSGWTGS